MSPEIQRRPARPARPALLQRAECCHIAREVVLGARLGPELRQPPEVFESVREEASSAHPFDQQARAEKGQNRRAQARSENQKEKLPKPRPRESCKANVALATDVVKGSLQNRSIVPRADNDMHPRAAVFFGCGALPKANEVSVASLPY